MDTVEIITTSDGSHTIRNTQLNETYHSIRGAVQESTHVFINHGLQYFHRHSGQSSVSVLEVGFGTGLNAFLTFQYAMQNGLSVTYTSIEPFPLEKEVWSRLNYSRSDEVNFSRLHDAAWEVAAPLSSYFTILKRRTSLQELVVEDQYDVIYFDAFSPSVQPELWSFESLRKCVGRLRKGGIFVTYCAKGQVKRDLRDLGGRVETLPGPPGKREMIRAAF